MDWGTSNFADSDDDLDGTYNSADPDYVRDNVFPRAIMVILVADVPQDMQEQNPLRLASPVNNANDTTISIAGTLPAYNEKWPLIFIEDQANGDEWVQFQSFDPQAGQFKLAGPEYRGARMTAAAAHPAGCLVKFGHTFSRVFDNPTGREYWGQ
jgi:hypothetical protein